MSYKDLFFPRLVRRTNYPSYRSYKRYRQEIREDCQGRCVYCDVHENELGGDDQMTLDHFRPKSFPEFRALQHKPDNLVWACRLCNGNKDSRWPAIGTDGTYDGEKGFVDPFFDDRRQFFDVGTNGTLIPLADPAQWMILNLRLNRTTAQQRRQARINDYAICEKYTAYCARKEEMFRRAIKEMPDNPIVQQLANELADTISEFKKLITKHTFDSGLR